MSSLKQLKITKRITSPFLLSLPSTVLHFDAYLYAIVKRKPSKIVPGEKYGLDVRLDPCELDWNTKSITITLPLNINYGIESFDDLDPEFFEAVEAAFVALVHATVP